MNEKRIQEYLRMSPKQYNFYRTLSIWGICISAVILFWLYLGYKRDVTGIKTYGEDIKIEKGLKKKIDQISNKNPKREVRSTNFFCPSNIPGQDYFSAEEVLKFPFRIVNLMPDSNYQMSYNQDLLMNYINSEFSVARMIFDNNEVLNQVYPSISKKAISINNFLQKYSSYETITMVVVPKGSVLDIELSTDRKKKVRHVFGKAKAIGSTVFFMREEDIMSGITIHELGHVFWLKHLHEGNFQKVSDGYDCDLGDKVYTTPATGEGTYVLRPNGDCRYDSKDPDATTQEKKIIYSNFMAYTNPLCMGKDTVGFVPEQVSRMRSYIDGSMIHRNMLMYDNYTFNIELDSLLFLE